MINMSIRVGQKHKVLYRWDVGIFTNVGSLKCITIRYSIKCLSVNVFIMEAINLNSTTVPV